MTLPFSSCMSSSATSAMRRSRSVRAARSTAAAAAFSHDSVLVPTSSTILYTLSAMFSPFFRPDGQMCDTAQAGESLHPLPRKASVKLQTPKGKLQRGKLQRAKSKGQSPKGQGSKVERRFVGSAVRLALKFQGADSTA